MALLFNVKNVNNKQNITRHLYNNVEIQAP